MKVLITGTPGTGKTLVAKELGSITGWDVFHISEIAEEAQAIVGWNGNEKEVDMYKLCAYLTPLLKDKEDVIFEGHLGCEIPCPADLVVVLRTNPEELEKRMEKRGYGKEKIDENMMAELLDYCYQLSGRNYSCELVELDTTGSTAEESAKRIYAYMSGDLKALDTVNWEDYLEKKTGKPSSKK
jgi:adenylate kinase